MDQRWHRQMVAWAEAEHGENAALVVEAIRNYVAVHPEAVASRCSWPELLSLANGATPPVDSESVVPLGLAHAVSLNSYRITSPDSGGEYRLRAFLNFAGEDSNGADLKLAQVMAAAPELLEALQALVNNHNVSYQVHTPAGVGIDHVLKRELAAARAAIAKARGGFLICRKRSARAAGSGSCGTGCRL